MVSVSLIKTTIDVAIHNILISISCLIKRLKSINTDRKISTIFSLFQVKVNGNLGSLMFFYCLLPSKTHFHNRTMQLLVGPRMIFIPSLTWQLRVCFIWISYSVSAKSTMMMNHINWYKI